MFLKLNKKKPEQVKKKIYDDQNKHFNWLVTLLWNDLPSLVFSPNGAFVVSSHKSNSSVPGRTQLHILCNSIKYMLRRQTNIHEEC